MVRDHVIIGCGTAKAEQWSVMDSPSGTPDISTGVTVKLGEPVEGYKKD